MTHYRRRQKAESVTEPLRQTTSAVLGIGGAVIGAGIGLSALGLAGGLIKV